MSFWTAALDEGAINYYQGLQELHGNEPNLVSYWNFNEGQGETINDIAVNSITGSINGATWTGDAPKLDVWIHMQIIMILMQILMDIVMDTLRMENIH